MKPLPEFELHRPDTLKEALELLVELEGSKPIAGGTDLLLLLRDGTIRSRHLVDLQGIEDLLGIRMVDGEVRIGAMTTLTKLIKSELIAEKAPVLRDAAACVGSVQTRNQGTLAGNLCNASPAADTAPALLVLDARLTVVSTEGPRIMPLMELFAGPKMNSLGPGELVTEVRFPTPPPGSGAAFQKLGRRRGYTLSLVNAAAYLEFEGDLCLEARAALGAIAATLLRMPEVEETLKGKRLTNQLVEEASSACYGLVRPIDDIRASAEYRREMSRVLMRRAIMEAWERARRSLS